jgi:N-acetylglucosamine kinase-like BadF-type ATPase
MGVIKGQNITLIAESSTTRTEWSLVEGGEVLAHAFTSGLNPFFMTRREISHSIRLELPPEFFKRRWSHVYFYGAGCSGPEKNKIIEGSLVAQFKTPVTVMSDLLGAARGLLVREQGLACILGTGSNSCYYDGNEIVKNVPALGFILGDEGSGAALGRVFLGDALKGLAPHELTEAFFDKYKVTRAEVLDAVLNNPAATRNLRTYSFFLSEHLDNPYVHNLIAGEFKRFFERNVSQYDYKSYPVNFVGPIATTYSEILLEVANDFGATVRKILLSSMPGLVAFHSDQSA